MSDDADMVPQPPRAEELIAAILGEKQRLTDAGEQPTRVVLSPVQYRIIQDYRSRLGEAPSSSLEYLTRYEIFGLEMCVEGSRPLEAGPELS